MESAINRPFRAFRVEQHEHSFVGSVQTIEPAKHASNLTTVSVAYSGINYKDLLSSRGNRGVTRSYPHTPGIDAAGIVLHDPSATFRSGDQVVVMGYDLGMNTDGGFAEQISVPVEWILPKPTTFTLEQTMQIGTSGFTAALGINKLLRAGQTPGLGPVVVTGATGGVGVYAVQMLSRLGFEVWAVSGKEQFTEQLHQLGAHRILSRQEIAAAPEKPLLRPRWAGALDTVGGSTLVSLLKQCAKLGSVATCGNVGGMNLELTVLPFILNGINLLGINAADTPMQQRKEVWQLLEQAAAPQIIAQWGKTITLDEVNEALNQMESGTHTGRFTIRLAPATNCPT